VLFLDVVVLLAVLAAVVLAAVALDSAGTSSSPANSSVGLTVQARVRRPRPAQGGLRPEVDQWQGAAEVRAHHGAARSRTANRHAPCELEQGEIEAPLPDAEAEQQIERLSRGARAVARPVDAAGVEHADVAGP
jgi:hypothetical protein